MSVQRKLFGHPQSNVKSHRLAEWVMHLLKDIDETSYARYAAGYREFYDMGPRIKGKGLSSIQLNMFVVKED